MLDTANRRRSVTVYADHHSLPPEAAWGEGIGLKAFMAKARQRRSMIARTIVVTAVVGALAGFGYSLVRTQAFSASSELLISNTTLQLSGPDAVVTQILVENSLIQSAIEILKSNNVFERVIDTIGLDAVDRMLPESFTDRLIRGIGADVVARLLPNSISTPQQPNSDPDRRRAAIRKLRSNTVVARVGASQIISVRGKAVEARDAAQLINAIAKAFVDVQNDTNAVVTTSAALRERIKVLGPTARIIGEAYPPTSRDGIARPLMLLLGAGAGGMLGLVVAMVLTFLDHRLRSRAQVAALTSAECFGCLPRVLKTRRHSRSNVEVASVLKRLALRRARSAVLERSGKKPRFVGVTSCQDGEGKTTVAAQFAKLTSSDGERVLFVDASCRNPNLSGESDLAESQGLHELLRGEAFIRDVVKAQIGCNLDFLPSGKVLSSPDLLWGNLVSAIGECEEVYDWIILDLPSLGTAVDVRSAGQILDDLLVVVQWGRASEGQMEQALLALGAIRERIVGAVINKVPWSALDAESLAQAQAALSRSGGR